MAMLVSWRVNLGDTLPESNVAPENRPAIPNGKDHFFNHPFSGVSC